MLIALTILHVLICVVLVLAVLVQSGRGAELGAAFGGLGQATYGRTPTTFLSKLTTVLAGLFMVTSLSLALMSEQQPSGSLLKDQPAQGAPTSQSGTAPTGTAPVGAPQPSTAAPASNGPVVPQMPAPAKG